MHCNQTGKLNGIWVALCLLLAPGLPPPCSAQAQTVRVGIYQNHPKVFIDEHGTPKGIFVDMIDEIARKEHWQIDYVFGTWAENISRLKNHEIDLLVDVSFSQERAEDFLLSTSPVLESWLDVFARREVRIRSIRDLHTKKIAVLADSIQEKYLREEIKNTFHIDFTLLPYPDYSSSIKALNSGAADVMVSDRFFAFSPARDENIVPAHVVFRPGNLHFAFPRTGHVELAGTIDRHITAMKNHPDSAYYRSLLRWLNITPRVLIPRPVKYALAIISGLLILIGLFAFFLRRQVAAKTMALRESQRLLQETQAIAGLGGWEYDAQTRRTQWTDEVYRIYGVGRDYDPSDVERDITFYAPQHALVIEKAFRHAVEAGEPYDLELELIRTDGERIWVRTMGKPVMERGKVVRVTGNVMNINASKRAEAEKLKLQDQLVQAQKMELVGRLAGGVAHDFNNMLSVILGYAELIMAKITPGQPLYAEIKEIYGAAMRSTDITRQLLAFARKQTIVPKVLNLNEAVGGMLKMLRRLIGEDVGLAWLPGTDLLLVKMDPSQIDQIMGNLCVNARDAIAGTGQITIETSGVTFDKVYCGSHAGAVPGDFVQLAVSDDGCGMDKEIQAKLFEPFFTTKGISKGTGLGLATVYGIVKQNSGFINVYSEPGKGTTFKIYLPRHHGDAADPQKEASAGIPLSHGETILIVEDVAAILNLGRTMLESLGYAVLTAETKDEALQLCAAHTGKIDLLITDVVMPDTNGRELAAQLRALYPEIKILFMSGYTANVIIHHGVLDEGVRFIQKPFSQKDLAAKVREALGQK